MIAERRFQAGEHTDGQSERITIGWDGDKIDARRARLTSQIARRMNAALTGGAQARRVLAVTYSRANAAARCGDCCPAEALRDYLRAYLPAVRDHRFGCHDWAAMSLSMYEVRLLRATVSLCSDGDDKDPCAG